MDKLILVIGPTGVGKTSIGIEIAKRVGSPMINGDSIQVYRGFDIGSAKDCEAGGVEQYLLDILEPTEHFSVQDFQQRARAVAKKITAQGKIPIVVGGTGLYTRALIYDYTFAEQSDPEPFYKAHQDWTNEQLYEMLTKVDPESTKKIHPNNRKRVLRALFVASQGSSKSSLIASQKHEMVYDVFLVECTRPREELNERINQRVDEMVGEGLENEVRGLLKEYPNDFWNLQGAQGIGYREWKDYFAGNKSLSETVEQIKTDTRRFAKRQYTWIRHQMPQNWYNLSDPNERTKIFADLENWLKKQEEK